MLRVRDLTVGYGQHAVLDNINLEVKTGSFTGLIGANGAGKSTLIKAILGLVDAPGARITIDGTPGYMPQQAEIDWDFPATLFDVALMGRTAHLAWWQWPRRHDKDIARRALDEVGLTNKADDPIRALSGGQRQRTLLARTLAAEPDFLILDEPFAGVDKDSQDSIATILQQLNQASKTILLVHHNLDEVNQWCDDVITLSPQGARHGTL